MVQGTPDHPEVQTCRAIDIVNRINPKQSTQVRHSFCQAVTTRSWPAIVRLMLRRALLTALYRFIILVPALSGCLTWHRPDLLLTGVHGCL